MARLARLCVPDLPHYITQRGVHAQSVFADGDDYRLMLVLLAEHAEREHLALHAYALLPGEVQLLATPTTSTSLSAVMQAVGRRYAQAFNRRHGRAGALWEGRFRATVLQPERYLLSCMVCIDNRAVKAGLAPRPADYPWSSHGHYAGLRHDRLLTPPVLYWQLGNTPFAREARYSEQVARGLGMDEEARIVDAARKGWALGDADFMARLTNIGARRMTPSRPGRPKHRHPAG